MIHLTPDGDTEHRWSGWPGAFCLDCFVEDQREICLADGCKHLDWDTGECPVHVNGPCEVKLRQAEEANNGRPTP